MRNIISFINGNETNETNQDSEFAVVACEREDPAEMFEKWMMLKHVEEETRCRKKKQRGIATNIMKKMNTKLIFKKQIDSVPRKKSFR